VQYGLHSASACYVATELLWLTIIVIKADRISAHSDQPAISAVFYLLPWLCTASCSSAILSLPSGGGGGGRLLGMERVYQVRHIGDISKLYEYESTTGQ